MLSPYQPGTPYQIIDSTLIGGYLISITRLLESGEYLVEIDSSDFNLGTVVTTRFAAKRIYRKRVREATQSAARTRPPSRARLNPSNSLVQHESRASQ